MEQLLSGIKVVIVTIILSLNVIAQNDLIMFGSLDKNQTIRTSVPLTINSGTNYYADINGIKEESSDYFSISSRTELFNISDNYTLFFWVYAKSSGSTSAGESGLGWGIYATPPSKELVYVYSPGNIFNVKIGDGEELSLDIQIPIKLDAGRWYWICFRKNGLLFKIDIMNKGTIMNEIVYAAKSFDKSVNGVYGGSGRPSGRRFDDVYLFNRSISDLELSKLVQTKLDGIIPPSIIKMTIGHAIFIDVTVDSYGMYGLETTYDFSSWTLQSMVTLNKGTSRIFIPAEKSFQSFRLIPK